ncbi:MAG: SRPBCC family protein [Halobacteria archaeon]|nr:SRPBCC family protein [Halobacteria archaeon]
MPSFERETFVAAPFEDVWEFHSNIDGLESLTPGWMNLEVESVIGPEGDSDPEVLEEGSEARLSMKPLGVLPRTGWKSVIKERREPSEMKDEDGNSEGGQEEAEGVDADEGAEDTAYFVDEMVEGPFKRWVHTHSFRKEEAGTVVHDRVEYELPMWLLGRVGSPFFRVNLRMMFRYRHRKTKEILEAHPKA